MSDETNGKPKISQRKSPKQKRSQGVVDAILTATTQILKSVGYDGATTNKIAERAGVSVGSFYQYFSSKQSLVATLIDKVVDRQADAFARKLEECRGKSLEETLELMARHSIESFLGDRIATRAVFEHVWDLDRIPTLYSARRKIVKIVTGHLEAHRDRMKVQDIELAAFIIIQTGMGVIQTMLYDQTQTYENETLVRELTALYRAYLVRT